MKNKEAVCIQDFLDYKKGEIFCYAPYLYPLENGRNYTYLYHKEGVDLIENNLFNTHFKENIKTINMKKNICIFGSVHLKNAFIETMKDKGWKPAALGFNKAIANEYICFHVDSKVFSTKNTSAEYHTCTLPQDWDEAMELIRKSKKSVALQLGSDFSTFEVTDEGFIYKDIKYGRQDVKNLQDLFDTLVSLNRRIGRNAESMNLTLALDVRSIQIGLNQLSLNEIRRILEVYRSLNS